MRATPAAQIVPARAEVPQDAPGGYTTTTGNIAEMSALMNESAGLVAQYAALTPRFEGWSLAPLGGVPLVGLAFVNRLNAVTDTWAECTGILRNVLMGNSGKLAVAAQNYAQAQKAGEAGVNTIGA
jgi:hypothetical protein